MPATYKNIDEARRSLLEQSKAWRVTFEALSKDKSSTGGTKEVATALSTMVDGVTAQQSFLLANQKAAEEKIDSLGYGVELITKTNEAINATVTEDRDALRHVERNLEATMKKVDDNARRIRGNLTTGQRLQLERSQTSIIVRNVKQDVREETYEHMEAAFGKVLRIMNLPDVKINYIRRLPRPRGDKSKEPLAMKVELGCLGDKIKIFNSLENLIRNKVRLDFQISNEIPSYAMNGYKYLSRVAAEIRRSNPDIKTRVGILRGDIIPTITVKKRNETKYQAIPDDMLNKAKEEVTRKSRMEAERRKREREERELLGDQPMDTGASGNN